MTDPIHDPIGDEATSKPDRDATPRTPGWVIILGIIAVILIVAFVAQFVLGIQHGPGMHG